MKEKKNNTVADYWNGIPDDLKNMCVAQMTGSGSYCSEPIVRYLEEHMDYSDTFLSGKGHHDIVLWIDTGIEHLFPLELNESCWRKNADTIERILTKSEELIRKIAPDDYQKGYIMPHRYHTAPGIVELNQKLNVYFCVLYMFTENWEKLNERLKTVLEYSERNISNLMYEAEAKKYVSGLRYRGSHFPGMDTMEPLTWLAREMLPNRKSREMLTDTYEQYALFLDALKDKDMINDACHRLHADTERRLRDLCEWICEEADDELQDADEEETKTLTAAYDKYEEILNNSLNRIDILEDKEMRDDYPDGFFATDKLRILLNEDPTAPVAIMTPDGLNTNIDCYEVIVNKHKKVIAIANGKEFREPVFFGDDDIPF